MRRGKRVLANENVLIHVNEKGFFEAHTATAWYSGTPVVTGRMRGGRAMENVALVYLIRFEIYF